MTNFNPIPSYLMATLCLSIGFGAVLNPSHESERFGIPLPIASYESPSKLGTASPFIYLKGIREITWGLNFLALQYCQQDLAITVLAAVVALASMGDGLVVWMYGDRLRNKAFGHWTVASGTLVWAFWRVSATENGLGFYKCIY